MIPFLPAIAKSVISWLTGGFLDKIVDLGKTYIKDQTSRAEFEKDVRIAGQEAAVKMEEAWSQALAETTKATTAMVASSPVLQRAWAAVMIIQVVVLLWYQVGTSVFEIVSGTKWPDPMADISWAYLLIGAMIGAGPLVFKRGAPT